MIRTRRKPTPLTDDQRDLAANYLPLALRIAAGFAKLNPKKTPSIYSDANLGLVEAARSFDESKHCKFTTHAVPRIRGEIIDGLRAERSEGVRFNHDRPTCQLDVEMFKPWVLDDHVKNFDSLDSAERMLRKLPAKHAQALRMVAFDGLNQSEAAKAIGCVQSRINQLVKQSAQLLS